MGLARRFRRGGGPILAVLALITVAAAALRISDLFVPMRYDEAFSFLWFASAPWKTGVSNYVSPTNHLLSTLVVHFEWRLLGNEPWIFRLGAMVAGIGLIPVTYAAGALLYTREAGLYAAALVAGSALLVQYSVNARGYMLGALFLMTAIVCGTWALRGRSVRALTGLAVSLVLAVYSAAFMALGAAMVSLWLLLEALAGPPTRPWRDRARTAGAIVLACATAAATTIALYVPTFGDAGWGYPHVEPLERVGEQWELAKAVWGTWHAHIPTPLDVALVCAFAAGLLLHRRIARTRVPLPVPVLVGVGGAAAMGPFAPLAKHWLFLLPIAFLVTGAGLALGTRTLAARLRVAPTTVAAVLATALVSGLGAAYLAAGDRVFFELPRSDHDVARHVGDRFPGRTVLAATSFNPVTYYFQREGVPGLVYTLGEEHMAAGRTLLITDTIERPADVLRAGGGRLRPRTAPRLVKRWRWISLWDVQLARP